MRLSCGIRVYLPANLTIGRYCRGGRERAREGGCKMSGLGTDSHPDRTVFALLQKRDTALLQGSKRKRYGIELISSPDLRIRA